MGLDNGVILENLPKKDFSYFRNVTEEDIIGDEVELCYWRKCWNVRDVFISNLGAEAKDNYETPIIVEDIPALIEGLEALLDKDKWDSGGQSIWEFDEIKDSLSRDISNLRLLKSYMETHPKLKVYFYDSY